MAESAAATTAVWRGRGSAVGGVSAAQAAGAAVGSAACAGGAAVLSIGACAGMSPHRRRDRGGRSCR